MSIYWRLIKKESNKIECAVQNMVSMDIIESIFFFFIVKKYLKYFMFLFFFQSQHQNLLRNKLYTILKLTFLNQRV